MLYLAALLHDIGKPDCPCRGTKPEDTNMRYYGHPNLDKPEPTSKFCHFAQKIVGKCLRRVWKL